MKFVYFGYDFNLPSIQRLIFEGHELAGIFSFEVDNVFNFNSACQSLANDRGNPFILDKPKSKQLREFIDGGVECFLSAGYPYKIPPIDEKDAYAVNVHPTRLPKGRGLMPIPPIILGNIKDAAGFTAHKMTPEFDAGDILLQEEFDLLPDETVESYTAKIAMRSPALFSKLMKNLPELWKNATPQDQSQATELKPPKDEERLFSWSSTVEDIDKTGRAFGRFGSIANLEGQFYVVYHYDIWTEKHTYKPGTIVAKMSREVVIAVANGFVCLKDFHPLQVG